MLETEVARVGEFGLNAALAIRNRTAPLRLFLMLVIAVLLATVGHWALAALWFIVYAATQLLILRLGSNLADLDRRPMRLTIYALSSASFVIAGFPTWHLWTRGDLGILASTMFLSGMLVQLVTSCLATKALFVSSAAPLVGYMLVLPLVGFGPKHLTEGLTGSSCALLLVAYLAALWRDYQSRLLTAQELRLDAEAANAAKTTFLANMSHEVRTPMNGVLGAAHILLTTDLEPQQRELVELILDSGGLMLNVVDDVLELSRIEAGKLSISPEPTDMATLIQRSANLWRPKAAEKGLALHIDIGPAAPTQALIDGNRVKQIIFNLLSNAIKFTEAGAVTLRYGTTIDGGTERLAIEVVDTGHGMDAQTMARVFAPFEQGDASITRQHGGSGIGLSVCRKLAEAMDGTITVGSEVGTGSIFRIVLPYAPIPAAAEQLEESDAPPTPTSSLRILVVDDNSANRLIVGLYLRQIEAVVTMAENGREALDLLAVERFDLVLMDSRMPVMDGLAATRALRASDGPNAAVPVLALSANVMEEDLADCRAAGMTGHVAKPIAPATLFASIFAAVAERPLVGDPPALARSA
jgi:signal transduction histidine kinase/CheY-like chemotaxis protein